jgi:triosephosphate isomerase
MARRQLIAGNWKMSGAAGDLPDFAALAGRLRADGPEALLCPHATLIHRAAQAFAGTPMQVGGQDCHHFQAGAHTGDIAAEMLAEAGASHVILGHSERRAYHGEDDDLVRAKALRALEAGLTPIICIGETRDEREAGKHENICARQILGSVPEGDHAVIIAYEPVWAIGTGLTPTEADIQSMHAFIRETLPNGASTRILYGGSMKPKNAAAILALPDVDGGLIGGASLDPADFEAIIAAAR